MVTVHLFLCFEVRSLKMVGSGSHQPGDRPRVLGRPRLQTYRLSGDRGDDSTDHICGGRQDSSGLRAVGIQGHTEQKRLITFRLSEVPKKSSEKT